jgi:hypothetical protein
MSTFQFLLAKIMNEPILERKELIVVVLGPILSKFFKISVFQLFDQKHNLFLNVGTKEDP